MKKSFFLLMVISLLLTVSCSTTGYIGSYNPNDIDSTRGTSYEDDLVSVIVAYDNTKNYALVTINNKTDNFLQLDYNQSSFVQNSRNLRIVDGESLKIDTSRIQGNITIAPKSSITRTVFLAETSISMQDGSILYLALVNGDTIHYCTINFDSRVSKEGKRVVLGEVSDTFNAWHIFFLGNNDNIVKTKLHDKAFEKFNRDNIVLENINYEGSWSALSLLLHMNSLGYVQKIDASATVVCYE